MLMRYDFDMDVHRSHNLVLLLAFAVISVHKSNASSAYTSKVDKNGIFEHLYRCRLTKR